MESNSTSLSLALKCNPCERLKGNRSGGSASCYSILSSFTPSQNEPGLGSCSDGLPAQKARSPSSTHINPGQQGGRWRGHCAPSGEHLPAVPSPLRETVCGLSVALSVTLTTAVRVPDAEGLNVTLMLQFAPSANEVPQLGVW